MYRQTVLLLLMLSLLIAVPPAAAAPFSFTSQGSVEVQIRALLEGADVTAQCSGMVLRQEGLVGILNLEGNVLVARVDPGSYTFLVMMDEVPEGKMVLPGELEVTVPQGQTFSAQVELPVMNIPGMLEPTPVPGYIPDFPGNAGFFDGTFPGSIAPGASAADAEEMRLAAVGDAISSLKADVSFEPNDYYLVGQQEELSSGTIPLLSSAYWLEVLPEEFFSYLMPQEAILNSNAFQLAQDLYNATTASEIEDLLLEVFSTIGVGVYDAQGRAIVSGSERGPDDAYLYEVQVKSTARHFLQRDWWPSAGYVRTLASGGMPGLTTETITGTDLSLILAEAWFDRDYSELDAPENFLPLMFMALDLVKQNQSVPSYMEEYYEITGLDKREMWDPLQVMLLSLDLLATPGAPMVDWADYLASNSPQAPQHRLASTGLEASLARVYSNRPLHPFLGQVAQAAGNCDFRGKTEGAFGAARSAYGQLADYMGKVGKFGSSLLNFAGTASSILLHFGTQLTVTAEPQNVHYSHGNGEKYAVIKAHVEFLDDYGDIVTDCGWMAGADLPKAGPMKDVEVTFRYTDELLEHGHPKFGVDQSTNASGDAYNEYITNTEDPVGRYQRETTGVVFATAAIHDWTSWNFKLAELAMPKEEVVRLYVSWHENDTRPDEQPYEPHPYH